MRDGRRKRARGAQLAAVAGVAAFLGSALPTVAGATDYCVAPNTSCGGTNVGTFEDALDLADDGQNADRIFLGAATYTAPGLSGFEYQSGPVEVSGLGAGKTMLAGHPFATDKLLRLNGGTGTYIHDLGLHLPTGVTSGFKGLVTDGVARRIEVSEDGGQVNGRFGVALTAGGELEDSIVWLVGKNVTGVQLGSGGGAVRNSTVVGTTGVESRGGTIERSRVRGSIGGVTAAGGDTTIKSSLVGATDAAATGIMAFAYNNADAALHLDGVTIDGAGGAVTNGLLGSNFLDPAHSVSVTMRNSLIRRFARSLAASATDPGSVSIKASYSDYDPSKNLVSGTKATISASYISNVGDVGFANPGAGDYHLLANSPLVDAGDPATPQGLDADGKPLVTDGDKDGTFRRDIGAFELPGPVVKPPTPPAGGGGVPPAPPAPPTGGGGTPAPPAGPGSDTLAPAVSGFRTTRKVFAVGRARTAVSARAAGTRFRYTLTEPARVRLTIQRARAGGRYRTIGALRRAGIQGTNRLRFTGRIGRRALRPGRYRAVITATDGAGNRSTPRAVRFRVAR